MEKVKEILIKFEQLYELIKNGDDFIISLNDYDNIDYTIKKLQGNEDINRTDENILDFVFYPSFYEDYLNDKSMSYQILLEDFEEINTVLRPYNKKLLLTTSDINNLR